MKKKILLVLFALIMVFSLTSCKPKEKTYTKEQYTLELNLESDNINILQLTDIHMGQMDKAEDHYNFMKKVFDAANDKIDTIDLVVVTGDLFTFATKENARDLFTFFDSLETPWTVTFGNHDEQCYFSIDWLTSYLNGLNKLRLENGSSYCYFIDHQDDDVKGNSNFVIDAKYNGTTFEKIIIMDSNRYYYGDYNYYDYMDETQVNWYKKMVEGETSVESLMFFHIPLPEFSEYDDTNNYALGTWKEKACVPEKNIGFFDVIKEKGTKGIFVGHDHINDYVVNHEKVVFSYGVKATNRVYYEEGMLGGTFINASGSDFNEGSIAHILFENYNSEATIESLGD